MQPLILITCSANEEDFCLRRKYCERIVAAGGIPLIAPAANAGLTKLVSTADALLLSGGGDADAGLYGETKNAFCGVPDLARDAFELELIQLFWQNHKAILGICRGMQMINIAFGGTLYRDIIETGSCVTHMQEKAKHETGHKVLLYGKLREKAGEAIEVNSFHHQGVKDLGNGLICAAESEDGLCEAFYGKKGFLLGVQWHPEYLYDSLSEAVFKSFILAAKAK